MPRRKRQSSLKSKGKRATTSPLSKRKVLRDLGVPKSTYYRWLRRQQHQQGLEDRPGASTPPWNRLRPKPESTDGRREGWANWGNYILIVPKTV